MISYYNTYVDNMNTCDNTLFDVYEHLFNILARSRNQHISVEYVDHILTYSSKKYIEPLYTEYDAECDMTYSDLIAAELTEIDRFLDKIPIEYIILKRVEPSIVGYLYKRWYPDPNDDIGVSSDYVVFPSTISSFAVKHVVTDILEKEYIRIYYTSDTFDEDVALLDEYAEVCNVTYERRTPYGVVGYRENVKGGA